jgi:hypothetical protein
MFVSGKLLGSPRHQLEGSNQAAFCQLYLETILALRAGISKRGFGSYSESICNATTSSLDDHLLGRREPDFLLRLPCSGLVDPQSMRPYRE